MMGRCPSGTFSESDAQLAGSRARQTHGDPETQGGRGSCPARRPPGGVFRPRASETESLLRVKRADRLTPRWGGHAACSGASNSPLLKVNREQVKWEPSRIALKKGRFGGFFFFLPENYTDKEYHMTKFKFDRERLSHWVWSVWQVDVLPPLCWLSRVHLTLPTRLSSSGLWSQHESPQT